MRKVAGRVLRIVGAALAVVGVLAVGWSRGSPDEYDFYIEEMGARGPYGACMERSSDSGLLYLCRLLLLSSWMPWCMIFGGAFIWLAGKRLIYGVWRS